MKLKRKICLLLTAVTLMFFLFGCTASLNADPGRTVTRETFVQGTLGVIDGSLYDGYSRTLFPEARILSYQSFTDLFQCVKQGKIDGFLIDIPNFNAVTRTEKGLNYLTIPEYSVEMGTAFGKNGKGSLLSEQMNEFLAELDGNGTLDSLWEKWCADTEPPETLRPPVFSGDAGTLKVALDLSRKPFVYLLNNEYAGFEVEILYLFCEAYGYLPEFEAAQWTAGVAGLQEGRYDILSCGIYMTDERRESVNFSNPYAEAEVIMVYYEGTAENESFLSSVKESFEKTFLREDRWKLIAEGIFTTLAISIFSVIGGTAFGFLLFMLARSSCEKAARITRAIVKGYSRLIAGTPALVILMILYYIVFRKIDNGIFVAVLGFTLIFGSFVYSHLKLTVESVDRGQTEAAYALGYSRNQTFFRIVLPQALQLFLPTYTGEVVGLIKATSVVGYIAVNDLTKMGDIIRSNTYEAFFPLIAVAVIYFMITWGISALLNMAAGRFDPKKRKKEKILKGVRQ